MELDEVLRTWNAYKAYHEVALDDPVILDALVGSDETASAIARHLAHATAFADDLPDALLPNYAPWALTPEAYRFGSEAYAQSRILYWLPRHWRLGRREALRDTVLIARQLIAPSAFGNPARTKRIDRCAFVAYSQAGVYWLYELVAMIAAALEETPLLDAKIKEYLRYALAAKAYRDAANADTRFGVEYLIDEIVRRGTAPADGHPVSPTAVKLVKGVDEFILNHEIAHVAFAHRHDAADRDADEAEADRYALEAMLSDHAPGSVFEGGGTAIVPDEPLCAYIAFQMWGLTRLTAEQRVAPYVFAKGPKRDREWARLARVIDQRRRRVTLVGDPARIAPSDRARAIAAAGTRVISAFATIDIDDEETTRIVREARALAQRDYAALRQEIRDAAEALRRDLEAAASPPG